MEGKAKFSEIEPPISTAAPTPPPWIDLPDALTANILQRLSAEDILERVQEVCTTWWRVSKNLPTWRVLELDIHRYGGSHFKRFYTRAVDRSQGELTDLKVYCYRKKDLLDYVVKRSSKLLRLTLVDCNYKATDLAKAIKKLPQLEELHLIMWSAVSPEEVANIGISCPTLKSFQYIKYWDEARLHAENQYWNEDRSEFEDADEEYGVAIGKSMPNLRHLQPWGLKMTNEGLEAILNGCPHLESLNLRQCRGLVLQWDLVKRCKRIKDLKLPIYCTSDFSRQVQTT
ncbi:putative F-box/LRR-repeat protein 23 [Salvia hispanica]|uniref:putative F-box/LRR-repeat protein 23 n=1 Tax=Salvia hispanica TaxID=49212 RepID=UPI002009AD32|nr:putative F-box/LRR-repeat protein 23 [Salvia hispanica]